MKKVLIVASVASMIDQFNLRNISILRKLGNEVHVATNFYDPGNISLDRSECLKKELENIGVKCKQVDFSRDVFDIHSNKEAFKQLSRLKSNKYNLVHLHSPIGGVLGRLVFRKDKSKIIYTAHGFHFYKNGPKLNWLMFYPIEKQLSKYTDVLITMNQEDYLLSNERLKARSTKMIHGVGVDFKQIRKTKISSELKTEYGIDTRGIILMSVGELNDNKNHMIVLETLNKIRNKDLYYFIVGKGSKENLLKKYVTDNGLVKNVFFLGYRTDVYSLLKQIDYFIFPSKREGLPVSVQEALVVSKPVIASNIRGNKDLIDDGKNGFLFSLDNEEEILEILSYKIFDNNISINYESNEASFSSETIDIEMERIYKRVLQ